MSYRLSTVANFFIKRAKETGRNDMTPMKLLKLVYISNGWSLAIRSDQLFMEPVEAWRYGPVVRDLYHKVKHYKSNPIVDPLPGEQEDIESLDEQLLSAVWEKYGDYNGLQLSSLTHQPSSPWDETWNQRALKGLGMQIPDDMIRDHYREKLEQNKAKALAKSGRTLTTA